jgi:hypothetical protein
VVTQHRFQLSNNNLVGWFIRGLHFEYKLNAGKNGKVTSFTVEARLKAYGVAGVSSYLALRPLINLRAAASATRWTSTLRRKTCRLL